MELTPTDSPDIKTAEPWFLYLLECKSGAYYTGITNHLIRRYRQHCLGKGAKYTRANPPVRMVAMAQFPDKASAAKAEWAVKKLPRGKKIKYFNFYKKLDA